MRFFTKSITNTSDAFLLQFQGLCILKQVRTPSVGLEIDSQLKKNSGAWNVWPHNSKHYMNKQNAVAVI